MKSAYLLCLALLLLTLQPAFGQPTVDKNCISSEPINMGEIGKDKYSFNQNGNLNPGVSEWLTFKMVDAGKFFVMVEESKESESSDSYDYYSSYSSPNFGLVVYDASMNILSLSNDGFMMLDLQPGTYYMRLDAVPYEKFNYTLIANNNFEAEPNDGISEANDIGNITEPLLFGGSIDPEGDTDFIKITLPDNQSGVLTIDSTSDISMVLYGYNESKKYYMPQDTFGDNLVAFVEPGTYYVRINPYYSYYSSSDITNYTLNISLITATCEKEPNDKISQALDLGTISDNATLSMDACLSGSSDSDYFSFTVPENMTVTARTITDGDTILYLYNEDKKRLGYSDDYEDSSASQISKKLKAGKYYLLVYAYSSESIFYTISVSESEDDAEESGGEDYHY